MKNSKGFTLIELLIVIGVLGILAAGLLAAVDPFEQLKKGRDTNRRNIAVELHNAMIRYYATHGNLPISGLAGITAPCTTFVVNTTATLAEFNGGAASSTTLNVDGCLGMLVADGELKQDYVSGVGSGDMGKFNLFSETGVDLSVCYTPESRSFYRDNGTKWDANGVTDLSGGTDQCAPATKNALTTIPPFGAATACYWCAK